MLEAEHDQTWQKQSEKKKKSEWPENQFQMPMILVHQHKMHCE